MEGVSKEVIGIIYQLLPGFIVAWILYGLTAHLKPSPFERIVQALIFTVIVRATVIGVRHSAFALGKYHSFGYWGDEVEFIYSIALAILIGLLFTWGVNNDFPLSIFRPPDGEPRSKVFLLAQKFLSKIKLTNKTLHPTEWYSAFNSAPCYIVLHLKGERRLYGWPRQFPDDPASGHFIIEQAEWLLDDGSSAPLHSVEKILVPSSEVERIEFLKFGEEIDVDESELNKAKGSLTKLYRKEDSHDDKRTSETTNEAGK